MRTAYGFELPVSAGQCIVFSFLTEWSNDEVNVTVQCLHDVGNNIHVNYSVQHNVTEFVPITVDIYLDENWLAFRCENRSIRDSDGMDLIKVIFKEQCKDPSFVINKHLTVELILELEVTLTDVQRRCNTIIVGPQSEYTCLCVHAHLVYTSYDCID